MGQAAFVIAMDGMYSSDLQEVVRGCSSVLRVGIVSISSHLLTGTA